MEISLEPLSPRSILHLRKQWLIQAYDISIPGEILATVRGNVEEVTRSGKGHLNVEKLDVDLAIKDVRMSVKNIFNNNRILSKIPIWRVRGS